MTLGRSAVLQAEDFIDGGDAVFDVDERLAGVNFLGDGLHGGGRSTDQMIGPDDGADTGFAEHFGGGAVILGRHDDERTAAGPFAGEFEDFVGTRELAVNQDRVGASLAIGFGAPQGLVHTPAGNERFDARDDGEMFVGLRVFTGFDLAAELIHFGERLTLAVDEAVGFGELLVFDTDAGDAALFELADEATDVVEVTVAGVAIEEDGEIAGIGHEFEVIDDLGPAGFVVVAHAELGGDGETGGPDGLEAGFADDPGGETVVGLHHEFELGAGEHLAQTAAAGGGDKSGFAGVHVGGFSCNVVACRFLLPGGAGLLLVWVRLAVCEVGHFHGCVTHLCALSAGERK
jgi:hypothetical protein